MGKFEVKKVNLYEVLADKLEEMIINDSSMFGQKLPSENELAKQFGVSRNIIREALKLLRERGLIVSRIGDGSYVSKPEPQILTNVISRMLVMYDIDANDVYEMRVILECQACFLAAKRVTEKDLEILTQINRAMEKKQDDLEERVNLDLKFHEKIAELSGNSLLRIFVCSMNHLRKVVIKQAIQSEGGSQDGIDYHDRIIAALRSRDANLAEQVMRAHLKESLRRHQWFEAIKKNQNTPAIR